MENADRVQNGRPITSHYRPEDNQGVVSRFFSSHPRIASAVFFHSPGFYRNLLSSFITIIAIAEYNNSVIYQKAAIALPQAGTEAAKKDGINLSAFFVPAVLIAIAGGLYYWSLIAKENDEREKKYFAEIELQMELRKEADKEIKEFFALSKEYFNETLSKVETLSALINAVIANSKRFRSKPQKDPVEVLFISFFSLMKNEQKLKILIEMGNFFKRRDVIPFTLGNRHSRNTIKMIYSVLTENIDYRVLHENINVLATNFNNKELLSEFKNALN